MANCNKASVVTWLKQFLSMVTSTYDPKKSLALPRQFIANVKFVTNRSCYKKARKSHNFFGSYVDVTIQYIMKNRHAYLICFQGIDKQRLGQAPFRGTNTRYNQRSKGYRAMSSHVVVDRDAEENLSDKEIFARNIPSIGKAK